MVSKFSFLVIRKFYCLLPSFVHEFLRSRPLKAFLVYLDLFLETVSYYLDLVKDWVIFAILYHFIDK